MSAPKKPGILGWILYAIALIAGIAVISSIVQSITSWPTPKTRDIATNQMGEGVAGYAAPDMMPFGAPVESKFMDAMIARSPMPLPPMGGGSTNRDLEGKVPEPKIIRNGDLNLRVADAAEAMGAARNIANGAQGFVEQSSVSDTGTGPRTGYMTLRIPAAAFDDVFGKLKALAVVVLHEETGAQDITAQFIDLEARLKNAKAEEASYVAILSRAGDIEDVLMVTRQLAEVRGRIEQMQAEQRYFENQTDLATIRLTLTEETRFEIPSRTWKPGEVLRQAFQDLVLSLQGFVDFLIRFTIALLGLLLPVGAFVALLIWIGWKLVHAVLRKLK